MTTKNSHNISSAFIFFVCVNDRRSKYTALNFTVDTSIVEPLNTHTPHSGIQHTARW